MRIFLAFRIFFKTLFDGAFAGELQRIEAGESTATPAAEEKPVEKAPPKPKPPQRSDAVTLLAALQREARFVDLVKEPLGQYSDEQIGAAARDVLRDCGEVLERFFGLHPAVEQEEGAEIEAPAGFDPARYRVSGNVQGDPPFRGQLVHHGWEANHCELPKWSGSAQAAMVVAPIELEVK